MTDAKKPDDDPRRIRSSQELADAVFGSAVPTLEQTASERRATQGCPGAASGNGRGPSRRMAAAAHRHQRHRFGVCVPQYGPSDRRRFGADEAQHDA
jgi:hypothetical protein